MGSCDPDQVEHVEVAGIKLCLRQLKSRGKRDIGNAMRELEGKTNPADILDVLSPRMVTHIASWSLDVPITVETVEDAFEIEDMYQVLKAVAQAGKLSTGEQKKSE